MQRGRSLFVNSNTLTKRCQNDHLKFSKGQDADFIYLKKTKSVAFIIENVSRNCSLKVQRSKTTGIGDIDGYS